MSFVSAKYGQFAYFSTQLERSDWRGLSVLDFGGNAGNMLADAGSNIEHARYCCLDIDPEAAARGRARYPEARFLVYDRWCFYFNPQGLRGLPLPLPELAAAQGSARGFDIICAYSVFTNTPRAELLELVPRLRALLRDEGVLAFTFIDPHHRAWSDDPRDNLLWRLQRSRSFGHDIDVDGVHAAAAGCSWCTVVNHDQLYVEHEQIAELPAHAQQSYSVFYTVAAMRELFPDAIIRPPACDEMQHCCLLPALETG